MNAIPYPIALLKRLLFALLLVFTAITLLLYWLLASEGGLNWALRVGQSFAPGDLQIAQAEGALLSEIRLQGVTYQQADGLAVQLGQARLRWEPWQLLRNTLHINHLFLQDLQVQVAPTQSTQDASPLTIPELNLKLPLRVVLDDGRLINARISNPDGADIEIAAVLLQAQAREKLIVQRLLFTSPLAAASVSGEFALNAPNALELRLDWLYPLPAALQEIAHLARGSALVRGALRDLEITHQLQQPVSLHLEARAKAASDNLHWQTDVSWDELRFPLPPQEPALARSQAGKLHAQGDLHGYQIHLQTEVDGAQVPPGHWQLAAHGDWESVVLARLHGDVLRGEVLATGTAGWQPGLQAAVQIQSTGLDLSPLSATWAADLRMNQQASLELKQQTLHIKQLQVEIPSLQQRLEARGSVALGDTEPHLDIALEWQNVGFPLQARDRLVHSQKGQASLSGSPSAYQVQLDSLIAGAQIPPGHWQLRGHGSPTAFYLEKLDAALLDGTLGLSGAVSWLPHLAWEVQLDGKNINPGKQWADLPGQLSAAVQTQGRLDAQGLPQGSVNIQHVKGRLRDYPLLLDAELLLEGARYRLKNLDFRSGSATLKATATLDDQVQARWTFNAPNLHTLLPQASGALQASGDISGDLLRPQLQASIVGKQLAFDTFKLAKIEAQTRLDLGASETLFLDVQAENFQQAGNTVLEKLSLNLDGLLSAHQLKARVKTPEQKLDVQLAGGLNLPSWRGQLQAWQMDLGKLGVWRTRSPADLAVSPQRATVADTCWILDSPAKTAQDQQLCVELDWQAQGDTHLQAKLSRLPLGFFQDFLPPDLRLSGDLSADLNASLRANGELRSDSQINLSAGELRMILFDDWQTFPHQGGSLQLNMDDTGLNSQFDFKFLENSGLQARLELPGLTQSTLPAQQVVQGHALAQFKDFALLPKLVPQIDNAQGEIELAMAVLGTLNAPQLTGELTVKNVATEIPDLGLKLHDFNAHLLGDGSDTLKLTSHLRSGEGELRSHGSIIFKSLTDWLADIQVQGKNLQAIATSDVRGSVSPELRIVARPDQLNISGKLHVPQADITPNLVIGGAETEQGKTPLVALSSDVVILQPDAPATEDAKGKTTPSMNTQIDVLLSLGDDVRLDVAGFKSYLGGAVQVFLDPAQGVLRGNGAVYISQGIFRAYGQDLAINQGFIVFNDGPLDNPGLNIQAVRTIHKDSNTPQVNKAGVHITGTAQNPRLALFSDPLVEDAKILSYIVTGSAFGSDDNAQRSLSLGGYIQPNFYVSFGFSLFDNARVFNLRYDLSEKWGVETSIGNKDSGVDISYTLGR